MAVEQASVPEEYQEDLRRLQETFRDAGNVEMLEAVCDRLNVPCRLDTDHPIPVFRTPFTHDLVVGLTPVSLERRITRLSELLDQVGEERTVDAAESYLWLLPRPARFNALLDVLAKLEDAEPEARAKMIMNTYTDSEIMTAEHTAEWRDLLLQHRDALRGLTLPIKHESIPADAAGDTMISVFHGVEYESDDYVPNAWTLSPRTALFFAQRFNVNGEETRHVLQANMTLDELNATATFFSDSRNESEVYFHKPPVHGFYIGMLN